MPDLIAEMTGQMDELNRTAVEFSDFAKITDLDSSEVDLAAVFPGWLSPFLRDGGVTLIVPEHPVRVTADERLVRRALLNLITNALQSTSPSPPVTVELREGDEVVEIEVRDRGPGVPESQIHTIFEPYFSTKAGGTGLGLAIARRIVEAHEGSIAAENIDDGGLSVTMRLPRPPAGSVVS